MNLRRSAVTFIVRVLLRMICKVEIDPEVPLPEKGPGILMVNHINFLEVPLIYVLFLPIRIVGLVKKETWDNPLLRLLANTWDAIPIERHSVDTNAFHAIERALSKGKLVAIAPEGTRSKDGALGRGYPGIVTLAWLHRVPIYPLAHYGGENIWSNLKRLRRTTVTVRSGASLAINTRRVPLTKTVRNTVTDELMCTLAGLLPRTHRGFYDGWDTPRSGYLSGYDE